MVIVTIPVITLLLLTLVPQIHFITELLSIPYSIRFVIAIMTINDLFCNATLN
jgi:hypothetical protein